MSLARASWLTVVIACAIAIVLFALGGYSGYAVTTGAVGLAAAINLLPAPKLRGEEGDEPDQGTLGHRAPPGAGPPQRAKPDEGPHQPAR